MPMADGRAVLFGVDQPDGREEDHITTKLNLVVVLKQSTSVSIEEKLLRNQALPFSAFFFGSLVSMKDFTVLVVPLQSGMQDKDLMAWLAHFELK